MAEEGVKLRLIIEGDEAAAYMEDWKRKNLGGGGAPGTPGGGGRGPGPGQQGGINVPGGGGLLGAGGVAGSGLGMGEAAALAAVVAEFKNVLKDSTAGLKGVAGMIQNAIQQTFDKGLTALGLKGTGEMGDHERAVMSAHDDVVSLQRQTFGRLNSRQRMQYYESRRALHEREETGVREWENQFNAERWMNYKNALHL